MLLGTLSHSSLSPSLFRSSCALQRGIPSLSSKATLSRNTPGVFLSQCHGHGGSPSNVPTPSSTPPSVLTPPPSSSPTEDYFYNYRIKKQSGVFPDGSTPSVQFNPDDTRRIFHHFTLFQLLNSTSLFYLCSFPKLVNAIIPYQTRVLKELAVYKYDPKLYTQKANSHLMMKLMKSLYFPLFTGGETIEASIKSSKVFQENGVRLVIDLSTEETEDPERWDVNAQAKIDLANNLAQNFKGSVRFLPVKLTCLTSSKVFEQINRILQSKMDKQLPLPTIDDTTVLSQLNDKNLELFQDCMKRLRKIVDVCKANKIGVWLDAEVYHKQPALNLFARKLMQEYNVNDEVHVYNTYQMYLKDAYYWLLYDLETAQINKYSMGMKLVRGAYIEYETTYSKWEQKPYPIWATKEETDKNYDKAVVLAMNQLQQYRNGVQDIRNIGVAVCTHNRKSLQNALKLMSDRNIPKNSQDINFAQLKGMADNLTFGLSLAGYNVCKLVPFGPFEEVWPYLMRRIYENQDLLNATAKERKLYVKEMKRRIFSFW